MDLLSRGSLQSYFYLFEGLGINSQLGKYMDSPCVASASSFLAPGSDCDKYIRPLMRPSTPAPMTFARRSLVTLTASKPPVSLSGSFRDGLTCFHLRIRSSNSGRVYTSSTIRPANVGTRPTSGRSLLGAHGPILRALGQHRPGDARMLGRERDSDDVDVPALL
jgi:hypothetical protein